MRELKRALEATQERLERLQSSAERVTTIIDGLPSGAKGRSFIEDMLVRMLSEMERAEAALEELKRMHEEFERELERKVKPMRTRMLMRMRYLDGLSWRQIGRILSVSSSRVYQMHRQAIEQFCNEVQ